MDELTRKGDEAGKPRHGPLPMILGCGLTLAAVLALGLVGPGWGVAVVALVLLVCPLLMLGLWWTTEGGQRPPLARTDEHATHV